MKQILIVLFTLTSLRLFGNHSFAGTPLTYRKVQIGINISPDLCFRKLCNNDSSTIINWFIDERNRLEKVKTGYSIGLNVCFNIKKFISLESGMHYSNKGYQTIKQDYTVSQPDPVIPDQSKFIYSFHYIDIPLKLNLMLGQHKIRYFTSVGLTTNFFIKEVVTNLSYFSDRTVKTKYKSDYNYQHLNLSPTFSIGIDYKIKDNMSLRIEPYFSYGLLKIIDAPITGYLYSGGLNIACYLEL